MFRRISVLLALQFTAFVALLMLINGTVFIVADNRVTQQLTDDRLLRTANRIITRLQSLPNQMSVDLLAPERDFVRIVDDRGQPIYAGSLFQSLPFDPRVREFSDMIVDEEHIRVMTSPILRLGKLEGFLQVGRLEDSPGDDLQRRVFLLLFTTTLVSMAAFFIGLYVAKRSLRPAEEAMKRLEQFTQDASHELRTPLAVLGSSLDLAIKTKNYISGIRSAKDDLHRITLLIERLLDLARLDKQALKPERTDVSHLVTNVAAALHPIAEHKDIVLKTAIQDRIFADADGTLLRQLLENLVGNALKFTEKGGEVSVSLQGGEILVQDTGPGIASADIERIFDRFYQSDSAQGSGGFGLGLALVKRIVDLHGWSLSVRSKEGKGTVFTVAFPVRS